MDFTDQIKQFSKRVASMKDSILTEEATKTSIVMPFFNMLGYDVFNPQEFVPEFTCDVGIKKGEKIDYAIMKDGDPAILVEVKWIGEPLDKHDSQLFRYFGTTCAKFSILTNGAIYRFYTDLEETNKMDMTPFLEIDLLNLDDNKILELKKFCKEIFDESSIFDTASELKYMSLIKGVLREQFANPSDDFVRFILSNGVYEGMKTQSIVDKYQPIVKRAMSQFINDLVSEKIQNALKTNDDAESIEEYPVEEDSAPAAKNEIVTTEEEIQAFYIVRSLLCQDIPVERIQFKDTVNYLGILLDGKVTKWICRLSLKDRSKCVFIQENGEIVKHQIGSINDLYQFKDALVARIAELS